MSVASVNFTRCCCARFMRITMKRIRSAITAASFTAVTNVEYAHPSDCLKSDHTDFLVARVLVCWYKANVSASIHPNFLGRPVPGVLGSTCLQVSEICVTIVLRFLKIFGVIPKTRGTRWVPLVMVSNYFNGEFLNSQYVRDRDWYTFVPRKLYRCAIDIFDSRSNRVSPYTWNISARVFFNAPPVILPSAFVGRCHPSGRGQLAFRLLQF